MGVRLHQGSDLSPILFAVVMDRLKDEIRPEPPRTMVFADDTVICSERREQVDERLERCCHSSAQCNTYNHILLIHAGTDVGPFMRIIFCRFHFCITKMTDYFNIRIKPNRTVTWHAHSSLTTHVLLFWRTSYMLICSFRITRCKLLK